MHTGAARSCEFDQLASLQIGQGFAHISSKRRGIGIVIFGQCFHDLAYRSSIAASKNFVRGFVQFDDALGKKQNAFASRGVDL